METSPGVAAALLQKSVRRGDEHLALPAAATLLRSSPDRFWRRLGVIAAEDVGLADLDIVGWVTSMLSGKAQPPVARLLVRACNAASRSAGLVCCEVSAPTASCFPRHGDRPPHTDGSGFAMPSNGDYSRRY
jgi:hypothetical protein